MDFEDDNTLDDELPDDLFTEDEIVLVRDTAFAKGLDRGRAQAREELLGHARFFSALNGDGEKFLRGLEALTPVRKGFDKDEARDAHGRWSSTHDAEISDLEGKLKKLHTERAEELEAAIAKGKAALAKELADGTSPRDSLVKMAQVQIELLERMAKERRELAAGGSPDASWLGSQKKAFDESKVKRDHGKFAKHGTAGESHPLAGKSRDEQIRTLGAASRPGGDRGQDDPLAVGHPSERPAALTPELEDDLRGAIARHAAVTSVGPPLHELYAAIGAKHDVSKHDFVRALAHLDAAGTISLSSWSKTMLELPDPELAVIRHGNDNRVKYYAHPRDAGALELADVSRGDPAINTDNPSVRKKYGAGSTAPAETPQAAAPPPWPEHAHDSAYYAKLISEGEDRAAKAFVHFIATTRKIPKEKVKAAFEASVKKAIPGALMQSVRAGIPDECMLEGYWVEFLPMVEEGWYPAVRIVRFTETGRAWVVAKGTNGFPDAFREVDRLNHLLYRLQMERFASLRR